VKPSSRHATDNHGIAYRLAAVALCVVAMTVHFPATAQDGAKIPDKKPYVVLHADEAVFDDKTGIVTAKGHVEIAHDNHVLRADSVVYNEKKNTVTAIGNVVTLLPTGEVMFSDRSEFSDGMREGVAERFRMLLIDNSRLTAARATRTGGQITTLNKALFSPCNLCKENPRRAPLWRLRTSRTTHDSEAKEIEHRDAFLEFYGIPVFYTPWLSHPDPTVKRRSGFLAPTYSSNSEFGLVLETPYFWAIDDKSDLTLAPRLMTDDAALLEATYRQRFANAALDVNGSFTQPERRDTNGNKIGGSKTSGHIFVKGEMVHDHIWRSKFELNHASDDTYLRRYRFPSPDNQTLVSKFSTEGFFGQNYASASGYSFQGLRETDDPAASPLVLPFAEYRFVSQPAANGAFITADASALVITRDLGADSRRLALNTGYHLPYTAWTGEIYELSATLRTDLYSVNDVTTGSGAVESGMTGRVFPQIKAQWRYPFARHENNATQIFEPMAAVILAPNGGNPDKIANEDSSAPELDSTNLFAANRFAGADRVEGGQRVVYGFNWNFYGDRGRVIETFLGQSQRLRSVSDFGASSGLKDKASDVVGRLRFAPSNWVDMQYRFRFDPDETAARRSEASVRLGPESFKVWADYLFLDESSPTAEFPDREELALGFNARLTQRWSAYGSINENLADNGGTTSENLGLTYTDECFTFRIVGTRNFTQDRDLRPTDTLLFQLIFKHLGEFSSSG
jgi:LPS-assembly protein